MSDSPLATLVGQPSATARLQAATAELVHAYLFVGPRGTGKRRAAALFAGEILGRHDDRERTRRLAVQEEHPDLIIFEPEGTQLRVDEVDPIIVEASRAPVESNRKVIVIDRFHDATAEAAAKLLKPIEEPNASVVFLLLTEEIPPEHVTIASRSTQIDFPAVRIDDIKAALIARGVSDDVADAAAVGSGGDINRAELLITDDEFVIRRQLWWDLPTRLDGSGNVVTEIIADIRQAIDQAQAPLDQRQAEDVSRMDEVEELTGARGSGRRAMEARHKREARSLRNDEWRMGLATLAQRYRAAVDEGVDLEVFPMLTDAADALIRNPNEELWLAALLLRLPHL